MPTSRLSAQAQAVVTGVCLAACARLAGPLLLARQDAPPSPSNNVVVGVRVVDRSEAPVAGLQVADFELPVDRRPMVVSSVESLSPNLSTIPRPAIEARASR